MASRVDPLGRLLLRGGTLSEEALADVLDSQRQTLPFGSLCYALGHLDEETLVRGLSRQHGVPGAVLDKCVIRLSVLDGVARPIALAQGVLPIYEDERRVFVACERPNAAREFLRELEFIKGKAVVQHVALQLPLARAIRVAYRRLDEGRSFYAGQLADADADPYPEPGVLYVVSDVDAQADAAHEPLIGEVTKEVVDDDLLEIIDDDSTDDGTVDDRTLDETSMPMDSTDIELAGAHPGHRVIDLDDGFDLRGRFDAGSVPGEPRVLIVDDDFATRQLLVKALAPYAYDTDTAASGGEAVSKLKARPPDLVIIDVMLPEIDGFQVCRSIKNSTRYRHIPVILMSAVIDSGRVTADVLDRYGADAYFEKPLDTDRVVGRLRNLLEARGPEPEPPDDSSFDEALGLYRAGEVDAAIGLLRDGLANDPLSAKHHFVLANLLQKQSLLYEAIDEYEATVDLKPDYFPALTRLAYLYYKKGFSAKAIETWRRSLQHCPDPALRQNIEVFMRKLIADMQATPI